MDFIILCSGISGKKSQVSGDDTSIEEREESKSASEDELKALEEACCAALAALAVARARIHMSR